MTLSRCAGWFLQRTGTRRSLITQVSKLGRCGTPSLAPVDLPAHQRDRLLVDAGGVPGLDGGEVGLARLVAAAGPPAVRLQKVRGRIQRVGRDFEIAGAVG